MALTPINISGWKWDTKSEWATANRNAKTHLGIPFDADTSTTQQAMSEKTSENSVGEIEFWYCGYNPQLATVPGFGDPTNFDINLESTTE